jgi:TRAP-type C4-dicarboxylate transport system permease small subunit
MNEAADPGPLGRAVAGLHHIEDAVLALLLGTMVVLAPLQIVLRNFFDQAIAWADPLLRVLVLWVGLLGALAATRSGRHITIDVVSKLVPPRIEAALRLLTGAFAAGVCGVVAWHAGRLVVSEYGYASVAFSGIPAWLLQGVIPFVFGAMALRHLLQLASALRTLARPALREGGAR